MFNFINNVNDIKIDNINKFENIKNTGENILIVDEDDIIIDTNVFIVKDDLLKYGSSLFTEIVRKSKEEIIEKLKEIRKIPHFIIENHWLFIFIFFAVLIRVYRNDERSIWWDEFAAFNWNHDSLYELLKMVVKYDSHPPLFYIVERIFFNYFGFSIFISRISMVIFSCLTIPAIYLIGDYMFNKRVAIISSLFLTFSPFAIIYSQEARMYSMLLCFVSWSAYFFFKVLREKFILDRIFLFFFLFLSIYTHYMSLPFLLAFFVISFFYEKGKTFYPVSIIMFFLFLTFLPWIVIAKSSPLSGNFSKY